MPEQLLSDIMYSAHYVHDAVSYAQMENDLQDLPLNPPSLYLKISATPTVISSILIIIPPKSRAYVIDVKFLGYSAFNSAVTGISGLRLSLENNMIPKVFFDARQGAAVLYNEFGITMRCVQEVQMMELAARINNDTKRNLGKLDISIDKAKITSPSLKPVDARISQERLDIRIFALPELWQTYNKLLKKPNGAFWCARIRAATQSRLDDAKAGKPSEGRSPWDKGVTDEMNEIRNKGTPSSALQPGDMG